jgi:hypothetical protein
MMDQLKMTQEDAAADGDMDQMYEEEMYRLEEKLEDF